jgi:hypothetical protein
LELTGNIYDSMATLKQKGVQFRSAVSEEPNAGKIAHFQDPDGNLLYMIQLKQWAREGSPERAYEMKPA